MIVTNLHLLGACRYVLPFHQIKLVYGGRAEAFTAFTRKQREWYVGTELALSAKIIPIPLDFTYGNPHVLGFSMIGSSQPNCLN